MKDQTASQLFYNYESAENELCRLRESLEKAEVKFEEAKEAILYSTVQLKELLEGEGVIHNDKLFTIKNHESKSITKNKEPEVYLCVEDYKAPTNSFSLDTLLGDK